MEYCDAVPGAESAFSSDAGFDDWVRETHKPLIRFCRQFMGDWAEAEDMAQEAYIRAWQKRGSFKGGSSLLTWLMAIARRVCLDRLRSLKRVQLVPFDERSAAPDHDAETKADVQCALAKLDADDRAILYLRAGEELPFEEIARVLGKTPAACRKRYERAKLRFEAAYGGREG
jgi:RNA polymerase sigma-70 factor (ECF subfamily)